MLRLPVAASKTSKNTKIMHYNYKLEYLELPEDLQSFSNNFISLSSKLKAIIFRGKHFLQPNTQDEFTEFKGVKLYVRKSLIDTYRNNKVYASAFKSIEPLEDFIVDSMKPIKMECKNKDGVIFNIMGQRISSIKNGLNIINGNKVLIKR